MSKRVPHVRLVIEESGVQRVLVNDSAAIYSGQCRLKDLVSFLEEYANVRSVNIITDGGSDILVVHGLHVAAWAEKCHPISVLAVLCSEQVITLSVGVKYSESGGSDTDDDSDTETADSLPKVGDVVTLCISPRRWAPLSKQDEPAPTRCVVVVVEEAPGLVGIRRIDEDGLTTECEFIHWPTASKGGE